MWSAQCCVLLNLVGLAAGLFCYNCSETQQETNQCAGSFGTGAIWFNASRIRLATCNGENAMCFVRSWSARAKHAWMVQRGCYKSGPDDPLPRTVRSPTRAMSCKRERYKDAEYKVCLCQADWCNKAESHMYRGLHAVGVATIYKCLYGKVKFGRAYCGLLRHGRDGTIKGAPSKWFVACKIITDKLHETLHESMTVTLRAYTP